MRRTKEEAAQTKQDILNAALRIFSLRGYQLTRLQDIAEEAGVTRGAIYHHFDGKAALYSTLLEDASAQESGVIEKAIAEGGSLVEIMTRILAFSLALFEDDSRLRQTYELSMIKVAADPELASVHQQRVDQGEQLVSSTASFIAQGIIMGELRGDLDPVMVARAFIAYQNGVVSLWLSNRQAFSLREKAAEFASIFMRGLLPS